ncbi:MAG: hypothetical protein ACP5PA_04395 [Elusimicrobiales bacterium]
MKVFLILFTMFSTYPFCEEFSFSLKKQHDITMPSPQIEIEETTSKQISDFFNKLDMLFGRPEKPIEYYGYKSISSPQILYTFDLNLIKDKYLYTNLTFKTSKNTTVYLSITKASNCPDGSSRCDEMDKFLLTFTANSTTQFVRIKDIINLSIIMSGSKEIYIDGDEYIAKVYANMSNPYSSRIVVKGPQGVVVDKKLSDVIGMVDSIGYEMTLSSKKYRVVYGRKVKCSSLCRFLSSNMAFIFELPISSDSSYYSIDESIYNNRDIFFKSIGRNIFFNLSDGILKVFKKE